MYMQDNPKYILSIESSCDETAAAVLENGSILQAASLATSEELHQATGGIVPEIAARKQVEFIVPVLHDTLTKFQNKLGLSTREEAIQKIDALAVAVGPGLIGSLLVGVEAAKALAVAWDKPLIPVNHLVGHIYANFVNQPKTIEFPAIVLIVSGGHTDLVLMRNHGDFVYLGGTLDDAAGEAFDKTARMLGLGDYYGGVNLSKKAAMCEKSDLVTKLPRAKIHDADYDFSFSGLKTAVKRIYDQHAYSVESIARDFEDSIVDVLIEKTQRAVLEYGAKSLLMGGGVAANTTLRARMQLMCDKHLIPFYVPPINLCTDNAIYIASAAYFCGTPKPINEIQANPSLGIMDKP